MRNQSRSGFTLLEVATVLLIIAILMVLLVPAMEQYRLRSERVGCTSNLKNLYSAAAAYLTANGHWPQIRSTETGDKQYADDWNDALRPFGIGRTAWLCPSVQRRMNYPDVAKKDHVRIDYFSTPFDEHPSTPMKWNTQPWFIERSDMHGNGQLVIFPDGSVEDFKTAVKRASMVR